ncbi:MAG: hypothetical protein LQ340_001864 [Diploschistes diacapsis]|nr:MAG: hypothetical protein LQ340_001864 [Diploschistes diacapsis]
MPAPTALLRKPDLLTEAQATPLPEGDSDELLIDAAPGAPPLGPAILSSDDSPSSAMHIDEEGRPQFAPETQADNGPLGRETRKIPIPAHRMAPLRKSWNKIYGPLVEHLLLQVRMNAHSRVRAVELRTSKHTVDPGALQKGEDFVKAFCLGFDIEDAIVLLRLDDIYIETFEIKDVKTLTGEHLSRAIGRIAGKDVRISGFLGGPTLNS